MPIKFQYASESDPGPYPLTKTTPIENGSDRHAIMVDPSTCTLYETWDTHYHPNGKSTAGSGAIWSLQSDALRPAGWTSADAAGLPILPGLVNYDEVTLRRHGPCHPVHRRMHATGLPVAGPARSRPGQPELSPDGSTLPAVRGVLPPRRAVARCARR